jgi:hypothetical protein
MIMMGDSGFISFFSLMVESIVNLNIYLCYKYEIISYVLCFERFNHSEFNC